MSFTKTSLASLLGLGLLFTSAAQANTTYDITFTDNSATKYFSNATGKFVVNSADQMTSFDVSITVLKPYSFEGSHVTAGEVLAFDSSTFSPPVTYNPATQSFAETGTVDNAFSIYTFPGGGTTNGLYLGIDNNSGGLIAKGYTIDLVSGEFSSGYVDTGNWAVTKAPLTPPTTAPEPSSAGILFAGLVASGLLIRRRRTA